ncbi:hypothetical protein AtEden1_Chr3g0191611 [Arabidopsis thaliana]
MAREKTKSSNGPISGEEVFLVRKVGPNSRRSKDSMEDKELAARNDNFCVEAFLEGKRSSEKRRYPPRLYLEGKSPLERRSMHHNYTLHNFGTLKDNNGDDIYNDICDNSQVGMI